MRRERVLPTYIGHFELQAKYKLDDADRFLGYNMLIGRQYDLLVRTVVFLLRPEADGPGMRAPLVKQFPDEAPYLQFHFRVVRLWEQSVATFLQSGIGLLPLVPLCDVNSQALPGVIHQMEQRIEAEAPEEAAALWTSTYILMGLRYPLEFASQLLKGVRAMKESVTYQAILEEGAAIGEARGEAKGEAKGKAIGEVQGERNALLQMGTKQFGPPNETTLSTLQAITTVEELAQLIDRAFDVESWAELLNSV